MRFSYRQNLGTTCEGRKEIHQVDYFIRIPFDFLLKELGNRVIR